MSTENTENKKPKTKKSPDQKPVALHLFKDPYLPTPQPFSQKDPYLQETNSPVLTPEVLPPENLSSSPNYLEQAVKEILQSPVLDQFPRTMLERVLTRWRIRGETEVINTLNSYTSSVSASLSSLREVNNQKARLVLQRLEAEIEVERLHTQKKEYEAQRAELDARIEEAKLRKRTAKETSTTQPEGSVFVGLPPKDEE
jgi:hypothetical protein